MVTVDRRVADHQCRVCGCDDDHACVDARGRTCGWAEEELCTFCAAWVASLARDFGFDEDDARFLIEAQQRGLPPAEDAPVYQGGIILP